MYNLTATNWSKIKPFYVEFGANRLYGDMVSKQADEIPHLLCLPGASQAGRSEFALMRQLLLSQFGWHHALLILFNHWSLMSQLPQA